jgi:hypothetical protein
MINPTTITNLFRSRQQLEEFLLFCILAAGKNAEQQATKLNLFLGTTGEAAPFFFIRELDRTPGALVAHMKRCKLGKYRDMSRAFREVAWMTEDLRTMPWQRLVLFHGVGVKTAKLFVLHSRGGQHAVLDTHVLAWMQSRLGLIPLPRGIRVPTVSPGSIGAYEFWETVFFGLWLKRDELPIAGERLSLWADVDLQLWKEMRAA